jgi:hypothetical protein
MKIIDLVKRYPITNLVWNTNTDTDIFWSEFSTLEDNGFTDPWGQRINLKSGKKVFDREGDIIEYRLWSDYLGNPFELVVVNV